LSLRIADTGTGQSASGQVHSVLCDGGYELHAFKVMPKRWIVKRSFAWLDKNRRLWKNCERKLKHQLAIYPSSISGADPQKIINRLYFYASQTPSHRIWIFMNGHQR